MIVQDMRPILMVEGEGYFEPGYTIPVGIILTQPYNTSMLW